MPTGATVAGLAEEFVLTLVGRGIVVDRQTVEQEMRDRIDAIADRLRVDAETVLREHASAGWGRQMAEDVVAQIEGRALLGPGATATAR